MSGKRQIKDPTGPGTVTRGVQTSGEYGTSIEAVGERAIEHHFGCERREPLRRALGLGVVVYQCPECRARVSLGPDGQPVGPKAAVAKPADTPPAEPSPSEAGYPTREQCLAAKAELEAIPAPAGVRSIAKRLRCNPSTVQRRLGLRN